MPSRNAVRNARAFPFRRLTAITTALALAISPVSTPVVAPVHAHSLPDLGDSSQVNFSPAQERKLGEAIMRQARAQGAFLDDPEVADYLNDLGGRLAAVSRDARQEFEFFAVPDNAINAFALPGGFIGVNTGLILLAQNESELASVLAHEITHVTQRHIARMLQGQQNSMLMSLAALAVALLAARAGGSSSSDAVQAAVATGQALAIQNQLNYTREFEYEADRVGFQRLQAAGFDVHASATFMSRLQKSSRFVEGNTPSYLRTHPVTFERIAEASARADATPYRQRADSIDFHLVRALLRSYQGEAMEAVRYFDVALAERKFNNETATRYGLVASLLRTKDFKRARSELITVEKMAAPHPMIEAMAAHVLLESGDVEHAVRRLEAALTRYPNKMQLVYDYPEALTKAKRPGEAVTFAEAQLLRFPGDGRLHRITARAYADLGKRLKQHYHQGEFYAWRGDMKGAIVQLELAIKAGDANFYDASVVDTRLRELRREMAEQQKEGFGRNG
ncbi:MAG TPA: M48 family metalloprotease [Casimicrobiaceae bacterium]|nr:M48 family metalloprotease [Casimicrobiaceae bacterium]